MIAILDYGSGNIQAIKNIYKSLNVECEFASNAEQLQKASKIILPGVGAFDETMRLMDESGLRDSIDYCVRKKKTPVLGICVGMQIMAENSEEGKRSGLGWFKATVKKFDENNLLHKPKIPHMGWNTASPAKGHPIFNNIAVEMGFYFLHSYYFECHNETDVLSLTTYGDRFASSVSKGNIFGFQFHPEKSHSNGINLFKNFADLT